MEFSALRSIDPVMWIIVASGVIALIVFIERSLHLHRARIRSEDFVNGIINILSRGNVEEALAICDETPGPVPFIFKTAIKRRRDQFDVLRAALDEASAGEVSRMERRLVVVATVAQIAPLLGLLGTILGTLDSVMVLQVQAPLLQSADLLVGLKGALTTTAAGLMVAIPCYAAFNHLVVRVDRIVLDMERATTEVLSFITQNAAADASKDNVNA
jgi:biopolymer transport protein ExbB